MFSKFIALVCSVRVSFSIVPCFHDYIFMLYELKQIISSISSTRTYTVPVDQGAAQKASGNGDSSWDGKTEVNYCLNRLAIFK